MNRPTALLNALIGEILCWHSLLPNRDVELVTRRVREEGASFLGIALPAFDSAITLGLEQGFLTRSMFPGFRSRGKGGPLPAFLQGLVRKCFTDDGILRDDLCPDALAGIRIICNWSKKPKAGCTEARNKAAVQQFINTELELSRYTDKCQADDVLLDRVCDVLWRHMFDDVDDESLIPRHGPGATAERLSKNDRFHLKRWYIRQDRLFPYENFAIPNIGWLDSLQETELLSEDEELPVRVVLVPKTVKTPRIIAIEPSNVQYLQQAVLNYLVPRLESNPLTRNSVRFTDQRPNKDNARACSLTRRHATLDLSEASDRVHNALVSRIFGTSRIGEYLASVRSSHAKLDGYNTPIKLLKYASMGSATCFPVEAMVFYTLIQYSLHKFHSIVPSTTSIKRFSRDIDVYGDDLIVPSYSVGIVTAELEAFGLKVNTKKSFSKGYFRESCGGDYYKGHDVTPIYLRHGLPSPGDPVDVTVLESLVSTSNQLYRAGYWKTCQLLRDHIEKLSRSRIPRCPYEGDGIFFYSCFLTTRAKYSHENFGYVQKRIIFKPIKLRDMCSDMGSLNKYLLSSQDIRPSEVELDFERSVKRGAFKTKRRWIGVSIGRQVES